MLWLNRFSYTEHPVALLQVGMLASRRLHPFSGNGEAPAVHLFIPISR
jgi:hypothetical protein